MSEFTILTPDISPEKLSNYSYQTLSDKVEILRFHARKKIEKSQQSKKGQFLTPFPIAEFMVSNFHNLGLDSIALLDAGAGIGSLIAAFVVHVCKLKQIPTNLYVRAYEIDEIFIPYLIQTLKLCSTECKSVGIKFDYEILNKDFIKDTNDIINPSLFNYSEQGDIKEFTHAILNPPYVKINTNSQYRRLLRSIGIETSNLYPGFMGAAAILLSSGGELVSITPRSFCNGSYFRDFRQKFLDMMALHKVHLLESRKEAFHEDEVLQETVIIHAVKEATKAKSIKISISDRIDDDFFKENNLPYEEVVRPQDPEIFIHIIPDQFSRQVVKRISNFVNSLDDLGLQVSTGRVVDFRAKKYLRLVSEKGTVPLIYPANFDRGYIKYPVKTRKNQAILNVEQTITLLIPNDNYVLTKRFSSKEEKKRVVAVIYDSSCINYNNPDQCVRNQYVAFENHLNYFHKNGKGLDINLARGLAIYLNSNLVDLYFRLFNGHTQVNATDLRNLKYPSLRQLISLGMRVDKTFPSQNEIDQLVEEEVSNMESKSFENQTGIFIGNCLGDRCMGS